MPRGVKSDEIYARAILPAPSPREKVGKNTVATPSLLQVVTGS